MRRLFFDKKFIVFTNSPIGDVDFTFDTHNPINTTKVLQKLENSKQVVIKADDEQRAFEDFCKFMMPSEAAGGLVVNSKGECLMIYRNGRWDLPKGHVEEFESLAECAERETEEECGVSGLSVHEKLLVTEHIYRWDSKWILKFSHWFRMTISPDHESMTMTPQTEEGIELVEWVPREQIAQRLENSYTTICEVFRAAGILNDN